MDIILASHNPDKAREFAEILPDPQLHFVTAGALGFHEEIAETGSSYAENARIKARAVFEHFHAFTIADDSGLSLDLLDGYPGIYSARFAGVESSYPEKFARLFALLAPYPQEQWTAAFHCAICSLDPQGKEGLCERSVPGLIIPEPRGRNGFGYDPIFYLPELGQTNAELEPQEKHRHSHRGLALRAWYEEVFLPYRQAHPEEK